uniref:DNA polymerase n=3 Tax=viral metagenome TaxID=1070528 RepID=A0A6H1Z961_9ZZZZ
MDKLINYMNLLKVGSSTDTYPIYAQYINSDGKCARTCKDDIFVKVDCSLPFIGSTNIFVLDSILKTLTDYSVTQEGADICIKSGNFNTKLSTMDIPFPNIDEPSIPLVYIDEEVHLMLKIASQFVSQNDIYENIIITKGGICSTRGTRAFLWNKKFEIEDSILINKKILSTLEVGRFVGVDENNNTVVKFDGGYIVAESDNANDFAYEKLASFISDAKSKSISNRVCSVIQMQSALEKLAPIFFGEKSRYVYMFSDGNKLNIKAETINGVAEVDIEPDTDIKFEITMSMDFFRGLPPYSMYIEGRGTLSYLYFTDDSNMVDIVLLGTKG